MLLPWLVDIPYKEYYMKLLQISPRNCALAFVLLCYNTYVDKFLPMYVYMRLILYIHEIQVHVLMVDINIDQQGFE